LTTLSIDELKKKSSKYGLVTLIACIGMFLSTLDAGIINVALPSLEKLFQTNMLGISWAVTAYLLSIASTIILFGQLGDRFGKVKISIFGFVVFGVSSIFCGISETLTVFIASRIVQGIGAAMLQANAAALITTMLPEEKKGLSLGTLSSVMAIGPILGPAVGGFLISFIGWPWLFWINVPFCLTGVVLAMFMSDARSHEIHVDWKGILLIAFFLPLLILYIVMLPQHAFFDKKMIALGLVTLALFVLFCFVEKKQEYPLIDFSLFKNKKFVLASLGTIVFGLASATVFIIPPFFLEKLMNFPTWKVGFVALCAPLGVVMFAKISGKRIIQHGTYKPMMLGLTFMLISLIALYSFDMRWSVIIYSIFLFVYGIGGGIFQPASIHFLMSTVPQSMQSTIGAINRMMQNLGIVFGASCTVSFMTQGQQSSNLITGIRHAWVFALTVVAFVCFLYFIRSAINRFSEQ